jgi:hypothetical protein
VTVEYLDLADSALHAPAAGFADEDFYPNFVDKAAVLIVRLCANHPLSDGNKPAAWVALPVLHAVAEVALGKDGPCRAREAHPREDHGTRGLPRTRR